MESEAQYLVHSLTGETSALRLMMAPDRSGACAAAGKQVKQSKNAPIALATEVFRRSCSTGDIHDFLGQSSATYALQCSS
jgi:hypothetical protein